MNEHFRLSLVSTNMITCVFFLVMGVFVIIFAVGILFGRSIF